MPHGVRCAVSYILKLKAEIRGASLYVYSVGFTVRGVPFGRLKTRDWKTRHQTAGVENAGLENAAPDYAGVENAGVAQYGKPKSPLFNIVTSVLQQPLELM